MRVSGISTDEVAKLTGVGLVREATPEDGVLDVLPGMVVSPKRIEEVSSLLAWANKHKLQVVPCGVRTKLDRGAPPARCDILLDLSNLSGIVEHAAGDLTVTVRAGTLLSDLQSELAKAGQFLAIDPPVTGSTGGLIAVGDSGPRRLRYGGVRDLLLGVTIVRADGVVAKSGGKVVKNVAGYDLPKLLTCSMGTLGVIAEATFRLYPLPPASATVAIEGITASQANSIMTATGQSGLTPTIIDYSGAKSTQHSNLAVRFESSPLSVQTQAEQLANITRNMHPHILSGEDESALWRRFDSIIDTTKGDVLARLITTRSDLPRLLESAQASANQSEVGLSLRAHVGHGHALLRWHSPSTETALSILTSLRREAEVGGSNLVVWRASSEVRAQFDVWGDAGEGVGLMRRVKAQFDPNNILNAGRFVGGI